MAKGDYYFPFLYQRFYTSSQGWTEEQEGAYLRLLTYQFDKGSIPNDMKIIKIISPKAAKYWSLFSSKFVQNSDGNLINLVMDDIRKDIDRKKHNNLKNGKLGGRPPKKEGQNKKPNGFDLDNRMVSEIETQTKPIPLTINQEPNNNRESVLITLQDSPPGFQIKEPIEKCLTIAMKDERWVRVNKVTKTALNDFNKLLEKRGEYEKNPADYKSHFANWNKSDESITVKKMVM